MDALINVHNTTAQEAGRPALPTDPGSIFVLVTTLLVFFGPLFVLFPPFPPSKSDALTETHNKLGPEPARSNLTRENNKKNKNAKEGGQGSSSISSLFVYPVEPCRGVELARAKLTPAGLEFDHLFHLAQLRSPFPVSTTSASAAADDAETDADASSPARRHTWEAITPRQFPLLATVEVELWRPDLAKIKGFRDVTAGSSNEVFLILRFPWRAEGVWRGLWDVFAAKCSRGWRAQPVVEVMLPVACPRPGEIAEKGYAFEEKSKVVALNMGCELPEELRLYLGVSNKLALFRVDPVGLREVYDTSVPRGEDSGRAQPVLGFQDPYPVHVTSLASLRDLESKQTKKESKAGLSLTEQSRANIFVSGLSPCDEHGWKKIKAKPEGSQELHEVAFQVSSRTHRSEPDSNSGAPTTDNLGVQMLPLFENVDSHENFIEVSMSIEVLDQDEHVYKRQ
ncbi:hypothetical protein M406DRAFT_338147 [Cryphonectria parasitica EP155]|uniref:Molybdenum cofactor sulfurase middle domain-containing protein n=1 Tax=Cryphonectria parasitica (strain ATCC 38755 / EP155) TaxID=660469 RepID=A0A9P4Y6G5_CRYP1|nr:uncharacterized protein M406DRAFT_338147 [Cryphonectria parasitica EP155]KAF3767366.1 hypothetical protein M406DRAFT_338147 [Cryphonectria parasitica EP155]